jgi:hypothetical protein
MSYTTTTNLSLQKAVPGSNQAFETASINTNWDSVDTFAGATNTSITTINGNVTTVSNGLATVTGTTIPALTTRVATLEAEGSLTTKSASYSLAVGDTNQTLAFTSASSQTVTVGAVLANNGDRVDVLRNGAGAVTFAASGVTLQSKNSALSISTLYAAATVMRISASVYQIIGDLA